MRITANGKLIELEHACSIADLLGRYGWKPGQVVVEYNGSVLRKDQLANTALRDGDRIEIIVPVAGG